MSTTEHPLGPGHTCDMSQGHKVWAQTMLQCSACLDEVAEEKEAIRRSHRRDPRRHG